MNYCIVLEDGQIIDINDYDILWLTDAQIDEMLDDIPNDYIYDTALFYDTENKAQVLNKPIK